MDSTEILGILGRTPFEQEAIPGRAIVKKDEMYFLQTYLPVEGEYDVEILENLQAFIQKQKVKYMNTVKPTSIPMLPHTLSMEEFKNDYIKDENESSVMIGLCEEQVVPISLSFEKNPHLLIVGQYRKGKTNSIKVILQSLVKNQEVMIGLYDNVDRGLLSFTKHENVDYLDSKEEIVKWLDQVELIMQKRETYYSDCVRNKKEIPSFPKIVFLVDHFARFQQNSDSIMHDRLAKFMKEGSYLGFSVIVAGNAPDFSKGYDAFTTELKQVRHALLLMKKAEQNLFTLSFQRNEQDIRPGYGYFIENGKERLLQIPYMTERGDKVEQQV